jgi:NAD(P)-dependent dehydrogenase (short-subunit alcohol dehydrogenase family)
MRVLLGARDLAKGEKAAREMTRGGFDVEAVALDVTDAASIRALGDQLRAVDVLINNAGVDYDTDQTVVSADLVRVRRIFETNLFGVWSMALAVGRIVNVSSGAGSIASMGRGPPGCSVSKAGLNARTRLLAGTGVLVNSVCPGWVATGMGGRGGRLAHDGAASVVLGAMLPDDGPTGGFFRDGRPVAW